MNDTAKHLPDDSGIEQKAAEWTLRIDRGLTASEQDAYMQWLADDPLHGRAMADYQWGWDEFDRLAGLQTTRHAEVDPDLLKSPVVRNPHLSVFRRFWPLLAVAAVFAFMVFRPESQIPVVPATQDTLANLPPRIRVVTLEDGSRVHLNHGATISTDFNQRERRVSLLSGEANFQVTHDPQRPFTVEVGGVSFQAVGTAFNLKRSSSSVAVIVTEGRVRIGEKGADLETSNSPLLEPGQRGIVDLDLSDGTPAVQVVTLESVEIERELAWQPRLLDFEAVALPSIVEAFNRANHVKLVIDDPTLDELVLSSAFWSDNVEGFVRLMQSSFSLRAEWQDDDTIVLRGADVASGDAR